MIKKDNNSAFNITGTYVFTGIQIGPKQEEQDGSLLSSRI